MKIYVSAKAWREGDGSQARPFKHINDAAKIARPGDEVLVAPGIYPEYVDPVNAGTEAQSPWGLSSPARRRLSPGSPTRAACGWRGYPTAFLEATTPTPPMCMATGTSPGALSTPAACT